MLRWDCSGYEPDNYRYRREHTPNLLVCLAWMLGGALIVAPFWIGLFEWLLRGRP